jgi:hypothetical protein
MALKLTSHHITSQKKKFSLVLTDYGVREPPMPYPVGNWDCFPLVKRQGREAHHSHPASAEVKKICVNNIFKQPVLL